MNIITKILVFFILCISGIITAQNDRTINELLEVLSENHMGSVTDVFSAEEIESLKNHFYTQNNEDAESSNLFGNRLFTSTENVNVNVAVIDSENLSMIENLGPSPLTEFEGAGIVILEDNASVIVDNVGNVFMRPLGTNTYNNIGFADAPPGESYTGLERLSDGTIFGVSTDGVGSSTLSVFDLESVPIEITQIGSLGPVLLPICLGRDENDNLFTADVDTDELIQIDKITGVGTPVGPLGFNANFGQGMSWDPQTQQLIMTAFNNSLFDSEYRTINTDTGLTITLGTITPGSLDQFAFADAFPDNIAGIDENGIDGFSFYPNPSKNTIYLNALNIIESIEIYSLLGQLVIKKSGETVNLQVDITALQSGNYILKVNSVNQSGVYKIIKQ